MKILFALIILLTMPAHAQTIPYMDGIPAMANFTVIDDAIMVFDKPEGQITEISLICTNNCPTANSIQKYYQGIFETQGWNPQTNSRFLKGNQIISMDIQKGNNNDQSIVIIFRSIT